MKRIAIIGSGIAGMGCAHFLHRRADIQVFEANNRIGGHTHTIDVEDTDGSAKPLDTGFMVYNEVTYPLLTRLFKELDVPTKPTSMSFSVHHGRSGLEWNGRDMSTLFAQRRNLFNIRHWRFLMQLNRFNKEALEALEDPKWKDHTLEAYVAERGYGRDFLERYLIPMSGAVWSTPREKMLRFPAITLLRFWHNHGFLGLNTRHPWRTVDGGSREYVHRLTKPFTDRIHLGTPVRNISRSSGKVSVTTDSGATDFDQVILATHADQALKLLDPPTEKEASLLRHFHYQPNEIDVHSDESVMPRTRSAWASWNYRTKKNEDSATVHYWMNSLQGVSKTKDFFVSLNTRSDIAESSRQRQLLYDHPLFDLEATEAQEQLPQLNIDGDEHGVYFCGSYFRYGFHEDAFRSAVDLCQHLLQEDPWS